MIVPFKSSILIENKKLNINDYSNLSPIQLIIELDKTKKNLLKSNKKLTSKTELKKQLNLLNEIPNQKIANAIKKIENLKTLDPHKHEYVNLIDIDKLDSKFNLKRFKNTIGVGYTSYIFDHPLNRKKIIGFTVDDQKIKWYQANKKEFGFDLIDTQPFTSGNYIYIYSMFKIKKLYTNNKMSAANQKAVYENAILKYTSLKNKTGFDEVQVKDIDFFMYDTINREIKDIFLKLKKTFSQNTILDLHHGQWGEDDNGKIILFDPVFSLTSINQIKNFNTLGTGAKLSIFISELFDRSNSNEIKKIKKLLEKK